MTELIPETIIAGAVTYRVICDKHEFAQLERRADRKGDILGRSEHTEAVIYINPAAPTDVQRLTLLHECLHCLLYTVMGDPSWENLGEKDAEREERVVCMFESPLLLLMRDNPDLVAYLTEKD